MKQLRYIIQACIVYILLIFFAIIGIKFASNFGSFLARKIGPKLRAHRTAKQNIALAFPHFSQEQIDTTLTKMWDNLGRTVGEMAHIRSLHNKRFSRHVTITGIEHLKILSESKKSFFIGSAHLANWEIIPRAASEEGYSAGIIYRRANNPYVDRLINKLRHGSHIGLHAKGKDGARHIIRHIKNKEPVGLLIDQKMNDGIAIPFFGHQAMTAPAIAELALKYHIPIVMARCVRTGPVQFEVIIEPPLDIDNKTVTDIMTDINQTLERWIKEYPEQWFWVHRRWPKEEYI